MNRIKQLFFTATLLVCSLAASAHDFEVNGIYYNITSKTDMTAEVTYRGNDLFHYLNEYIGEITIPSTVTYGDNTYSVTSIGTCACFECLDLTSITIPESVTNIGSDAFYNCISLTSINIPKRVTSIESHTFWGCQSLTSITIPESVTSIGSDAFNGCFSLTSITIPEGVTSIEDGTFSGCCSLTAITIPESVTSIGSRAFEFSDGLTSITIPESVTSIGGNAFRMNGGSLTAVHISSIKSWCEVAFNGSYSNPLYMAQNLYLNGELATNLSIPEGVTSIGDHVFQGCTCLTSITFPESITSIGKWAFRDCCNLLDVYCYAFRVPSTETDAFYNSNYENAILHVPSLVMEAYRNTAPWNSFGTLKSATNVLVADITLSQTSANLTEGEILTLIATVIPNNATDKSITWSSSDASVANVDENGKVIAVAPGTAVITATANDGSGVSASCEVTVNEILGKCAEPIMNYENGKVWLTCSTEGAEVTTNITIDHDLEYQGMEFDLVPTYTLTAYATKEKFKNSDIVTLTLCWIACNEDVDEPGEGVVNIPSKTVLIQSQGGTITLNGLAEGTEVAVYDSAGHQLAIAVAMEGTATLSANLTAGATAIVKIAGQSIKVVMK